MMDIKLIASDIDGTILPNGGEISDETRRAVHLCAEHGIKFVISSGRWYASAKAVATDLNLEEGWMIIANGAAIVEPDGTPVKEWAVSKEDVKNAYAIMQRYDVMINAFVRNAIYRVNTQALKSPMPGMKSYLDGDDYRIVNDDRQAFESIGLIRPYKLEAYSDDFELLARLRVELVEAGLSVSSSFPRNLEIMSEGMGKGTALRWLADSIGASLDQCMAFGDNTNDLQMLEVAGWPVAVGNAVEEVKACARIIAPACADNGVARIIVDRVLGGK